MRLSAFVASVALSLISNFAAAQDAKYPFTITALSCEKTGSLTIVEMKDEQPVLLGAPETIVQRSAVGFVLQYKTVWEGVPLVQNDFLERRNKQWTLIKAIGGQPQKETCLDVSSIVEDLLPVVEEYADNASLRKLSQMQTELDAMTLKAQELRPEMEKMEAEIVKVVPSGPPLSSGEKESLRVAVSSCWSVGSLSSEALQTTVTVSVAMNTDGTPIVGSISLDGSSGGSTAAARQAFEVARRAIIRCGASGFDLPNEKYGQWQQLEMTFNPERIRVK